MTELEHTEALLRGLQTWCAHEIGASGPDDIPQDLPFHTHREEWGKRFKLRTALLPWVLERTGLPTFYPDELGAHSTPRTVARHLAHRMVVGDPPVRPPVLPRPGGKVQEPTVFVLGCPRSGTTIFRSMLMGHPEIYAGPELHLMQFDSMRQRERALVDRELGWMVMGLSQTLQHLTGWSEREAFHYVSTLTRRDVPVAEMYRIIHAYCRKPIVVDKSPTLSWLLSTLERLESTFAQPRYLFITRHPYAVIESMKRLVNRGVFKDWHWKDTEAALWHQTNHNCLTFLNTIARDRWHQLSYEALMRDPDATLRGVTTFLGVAYEPQMANPYEGERLLSGVGCVNAAQRERVDPALADAWRGVRLEQPLPPETVALANTLGYECP